MNKKWIYGVIITIITVILLVIGYAVYDYFFSPNIKTFNIPGLVQLPTLIDKDGQPLVFTTNDGLLKMIKLDPNKADQSTEVFSINGVSDVLKVEQSEDKKSIILTVEKGFTEEFEPLTTPTSELYLFSDGKASKLNYLASDFTFIDNQNVLLFIPGENGQTPGFYQINLSSLGPPTLVVNHDAIDVDIAKIDNTSFIITNTWTEGFEVEETSYRLSLSDKKIETYIKKEGLVGFFNIEGALLMASGDLENMKFDVVGGNRQILSSLSYTGPGYGLFSFEKKLFVIEPQKKELKIKEIYPDNANVLNLKSGEIKSPTFATLYNKSIYLVCGETLLKIGTPTKF